MAYFCALIRLFVTIAVCIVGGFACSPSWAAFPAVALYKATGCESSASWPVVAACKLQQANPTQGPFTNCVETSRTATTLFFQCDKKPSVGGTQASSLVIPAPTCGTGGTNSGGVCTCNVGYTQDETKGLCRQVSCPAAGVVEGSSDNAVQSSAGASKVCLGESGASDGCAWEGGGSVPQVCANGKCYTFGPFRASGLSCSTVPQSGPATPTDTGPAVPVPAASAPDDHSGCIAKGSCPGTVNGAFKCVACSTKTTTSSVSSSASGVETNASGVASGTGTTAGNTKRTTTCAGGYCSVVEETEVTNPDGSKSKTTSERYEDKPRYCAENPNDIQCKEEGDESSFGGGCGSFSCEGDAVQCAIAKEVHQRNCALFDDQTDLSQSGVNIADNNSRPSGHPANDVQAVSWTALDETNPFGSSCPGDFQLDVIGTSVSVPLSSACSSLQFMGLAALAFTAIACARIVFGGFAG
jgi:hypothetical protein